VRGGCPLGWSHPLGEVSRHLTVVCKILYLKNVNYDLVYKMGNVSKGSCAVSRSVFVGSVVVLLVVCITVGFVGYYRVNALQASNDQLQTNYDNLQSSYSQLQSSSTYNQNLQNQYNQLQSSYNQLNSQYQQLLTKVPASNGIVIESIDYKPYYLTPSGVYNVTIRNLGSSDVHVTSLKLYHGTTLGSSASIFIPISANSTVTISKFLAFTIGVDIHVLKVETLEGYTLTSDPISQG
jgi:hypothetical protein